jgi:nicotinamidase-related amidase
MKGSLGVASDGRIDPPEATYVSKWRSDAFCNPDLMALLNEARVGQLRLAGLFTKACVSATAKAAHKRGLSVQVIVMQQHAEATGPVGPLSTDCAPSE